MKDHWLKEWGKGKPPSKWVIEIIDDTLSCLEGMTKEEESAIAVLNEELTQKFLKKVKPNCFLRENLFYLIVKKQV